MAKAIITLKIMPISPEVDMEQLEVVCMEKIVGFTGKTETKVDIEPIAFGLKALNIKFVMDEDLGSTETLEKTIEDLDNVSSVEVTDMRRAIQ